MEGHKAPHCGKCSGARILIEPAVSRAEARVCECSRHCPDCHDAHFLFERDAHGREIARMCDCEQRRIRIRMYNEAGVPAKYHDARLSKQFKDKDNEEAFHTLFLHAKNFQKGQKGILLMGPSGVGKTFLVAGFIHEIVFKHGIPAQFRDFFQLLADLRSGYSHDKPESELIQPLVAVEVLVIDELGKGRNTPWEQNILDVIISHRYNSQKTTVFTSNFTEHRSTTLAEPFRGKDVIPGESDRVVKDTLLERIGPRIYSRLKEMCHFITIQGADRRELDMRAG